MTSWTERADAAEAAVLARYVRHVPGFAWARASWPHTGRGGPWHYWWHAHLIDAMADAARRRPSALRRRRVTALVRTVAVRTGGRWVNRFSDDTAWMGLALHRAAPASRAIHPIVRTLRARIDPRVGALPWHVGSGFFNAPANGPAAILLARTGHVADAERLTGWMDRELADSATGLVRDGLGHPELYTYNQGVAIGAALALATGAGRARHLDRTASLVAAVDAWAPALLPSPGGGDGGLFAGILCRYLAEAARTLEGAAGARARELVVRNAEALWRGRADLADGPLFSADPRRAAAAPPTAGRAARPRSGTVAGSPHPDGDLSVQLGAWLTLEAAATLAR